MSFEYMSIEQAVLRPGLRMVVVGGIPSPWGEAAKGLFHIKGLDWSAVRLDYTSDAMKQFAGGRRDGPWWSTTTSRPATRGTRSCCWPSGWRRSPRCCPPTPRSARWRWAWRTRSAPRVAWAGRAGCSWSTPACQAQAAASPQAAAYLARKYGYRAEEAPQHGRRVVALLGMLTARLRSQHAAGQRCLLGSQVTAVDVYSATFMALFKPLPQTACAMDPATRQAFETLDDATAQALSPELLAHRDWMYERWLELPLRL